MELQSPDQGGLAPSATMTASDSPSSKATLPQRRYLPPDLRYLSKSNSKPDRSPFISNSPPPQIPPASIPQIAPSSSSSAPPTVKPTWKSRLHPRPFTEYMALNIGIFSGFGLAGSSVGGLIAGAGLGLVFGLGAASLVAATWELCAPGSGKRVLGLALEDNQGVVAGYRERSQSEKEAEEWDRGGIEMVDLGSGGGNEMERASEG